MTKDFQDKILSDLEKSKLQGIADDPVALDALKKVFLAGVYYNGTLEGGQAPDPTRNFMLALANRKQLSDDQLGREVRASLEAVAMIETSITELASFKSPEANKRSQKNHAR